VQKLTSSWAFLTKWETLGSGDGQFNTSLRARIARDRQLPIEEALRLTCEIASALAYAH